MDKEIFYELVDRYLAGTATAEEIRIVEAWYARLAEGSSEISQQEKERLDKSVLQAVLHRTQENPGLSSRLQSGVPFEAEAKTTPLYRKLWFRFAVASVLLVIAGGWFIRHGFVASKELAELPQEQRFKNDIAPASQGVTLSFGDNKQIQLDTLLNGTISLGNALAVQKKDDELTYRAGNGEVQYHTVATGKGKHYNLELADGTRVWLDAESSLHFPTFFPGNERIVTVTGQAYFEVAKDKSKPFLVKTQDVMVNVLGTHFNINAHESIALTTLLEGSIRITSSGNQSRNLTPGQQAGFLPNGNVMMISNADMDEVMAWKNGLFRFNGSSIREIMVQLERWYDISVDYENDEINQVSLVAKINRNENLSTILKLLEMTEHVKFTINGNKVTVISQKVESP
jgi:transmembrane sensor